jgi:hypothetical protein
MDDLAVSFRELYPRLSLNGVYIAEDVYTSYFERFGGGYKREGSFVETVKDLIDELHAEHLGAAFEETEFSRSTLSVHVYSGLVVFERGRHLDKRSQNTGLTEAARAAAKRVTPPETR